MEVVYIWNSFIFMVVCLTTINTDVNECSVLNGGCEHECTNLIGSYECSCNEGFALGDNERNCMGKYVFIFQWPISEIRTTCNSMMSFGG